MFRLAKDLKYIINKTNKTVFLSGEHINDIFYYDFYYGSLSLKDSLYYFFRREFKVDIGMYIDINMNLNCFNKRTYTALDEYYYSKEENLKLNLELKDLSAGIYNVKLITPSSIIAKELSIIK